MHTKQQHKVEAGNVNHNCLHCPPQLHARCTQVNSGSVKCLYGRLVHGCKIILRQTQSGDVQNCGAGSGYQTKILAHSTAY